LNDLVTLIVMSQNEEPIAQCLLGCESSRDEIGVGRRGEIPGTVDPSLAIRIRLLTEQEQGQRGLLRFDERACHGESLPNRARPQARRLAPCRGSCNSGNNPASRAVITPGGARNRSTKKDEYMSDVMDTETADGIVLTDEAASKVKTLLEAEGRDDLTLRIAVQPGGCSGLRYQLFFDDRNLDGDVLKDFSGVGVVTDRMSAPYLSGATIDFVDTIEKQGFTIDNPNAQGSCACGDSFH